MSASSQLLLIISFCLISLSPWSRAMGQHTLDKSTATLQQLRAQLRIQILSSLIPEKIKLKEQLFEIEKQQRAERDYLSAIQTRDARLLLEDEIQTEQRFLQQPLVLQEQFPDSILLKLHSATLKDLTLSPDQITLETWQNTSEAVWELPNLPSGGYEVFVAYESQSIDSIQLKFETQPYYLHASLAPSDNAKTEHLLGTLRIYQGSTHIKVSVVDLPSNATLKLHKLLLKPANH